MTYHPEVQNDFIWVVLGSPWGWLAIWLILINLVTFFVFGLDKLKAFVFVGGNRRKCGRIFGHEGVAP